MISIMKHFTKKDWAWTTAIFFTTIFEVMSGLMTVVFMQKIVALLVPPLLDDAVKQILISGGIMVSFAVLSVILGIINSFISVRLATNYSRTLRGKLFEKVNSFTMEEINRFTTPSLITRSTNDIQQVQMALATGLRMIFVAPIIAIASIIMIVKESSELSITTAIGIFILVATIMIVFSLVFPKFKLIQEYTDKLNGVSREHLTGLRVVKAYNAEDYQQNKLEDVNHKLSLTRRFVTRMMAILVPGCYLIMDILGLVIIWFGSYLINDGMITLPEVTAFEMYANMVLMAFMMMTMMALMLPRAAIAAKRVNEVIETTPSVVDSEHPISPKEDIRGSVEFKNVSFTYPDAKNYALHNISFSLNKGETLAIIGATGSGKSTLVNLIPRFFDVQEGEILIDGVNVKDMKQSDLRARLGIASQKAILFSGTIEDNIKFSNKNMSDSDMVEAAQIASADEFIENSEDKYHEHVAQGGNNFSGGQKQRLSIARTVAKKPEIYIFDDTFSALDYATDKRVRTALADITKDSSVIIVAQRIGTIMNADKILVLDQGEIVGLGTHAELIKNSEVYKEIALSQLSKEELQDAQS